MKISERRLHTRIPVSGLARLNIAGNNSLVELRNLSPTGVQVEISDDDMRHLSDLCSVDGNWPLNEIQLMPDDSLELQEAEATPWIQCRLVFSRRLSQHRYLVGFSFVITGMAARECILQIISQADGNFSQSVSSAR